MTIADALASAVAQHIAERGVLLDPLDAMDRCQSESAAFMETLAAFGINATVVTGLMMRGKIILAGHFAVRVGDDVWDWTSRQFDAEAPVPLITPWDQWRREWSNVSEGWLDPLNGVCPCDYHSGRVLAARSRADVPAESQPLGREGRADG